MEHSEASQHAAPAAYVFDICAHNGPHDTLQYGFIDGGAVPGGYYDFCRLCTMVVCCPVVES
jgi:hypothetical protein